MSTHDAAGRLLEALLTHPERREDLLRELGPAERRALLRHLQAHGDVFMAQGHRLAARVLLDISLDVAGADPDLSYGVERARIRWLEREGLAEDSLAALQRLYDSYRRSRRHPQRGAELAMELGIMLDRSGRKLEALKLFRGAAERYQRMGQGYNRAAALFNGASVLYDLGRFGPSLKTCLQALREGGAGHLDLEAHITLQMANSYESRGEPEAAGDCYQMAAESYGRMKNRKQESDIRYRLGWLAMRRGEAEEAAPPLQQALDLKREHDYGAGLARYHLHRAESYRSAGLPDAARHHYRASLGLAAAMGAEDLALRARFGLCLLAGGHGRSLPSYLKLPAPAGGENSLNRGRLGVYCEQVGEGASTLPWRQSGDPESPSEDRTFLARLLRDLARCLRLAGQGGTEHLHRQERAVQAWQTRSRKVPRGGQGPATG